ncbi:ATPase family AAA domain-containing protein 3, partial [Linum perenne]
KLAEHRAQVKSQMAQYEDDLARKRMQADNEHQRARNQELVKLQEESSIRQEQARRATEEQIQAQRRQTEREKAEIERETIRVRAMAEAEGRAHEAKLAEDVNRRILIDRANAEREKWVAAINTTFDHVGGGLKAVLTDQNKLVVMVGGVTALAAGIYTTREGAKVMWSYVDRVLGQPSLIRESSRGKYPWSGAFKRGLSSLSSGASKGTPSNGNGFGDVILHPSLQKRIQQLANATANTKSHQAPFRNMLFYGPPGTGKTMAARELARKSGLDYALMTGGDVAPLGSQAVTKIHQLFDWAKKSKRGLLLFIDEADAFLCERNKTYMSEAQRSALNALLFRTGDQSKDIVLALATNRPGDLDSAVSDRVDEVLEFPLPGEDERFKLLKLYLDKYIAQAGSGQSGNWVQKLLQKQVQKIEMKDVTDEVIREAAAKTVGFSGREIAKLMAGVQAAVYGKRDCVLDQDLFREVVDYKKGFDFFYFFTLPRQTSALASSSSASRLTEASGSAETTEARSDPIWVGGSDLVGKAAAVVGRAAAVVGRAAAVVGRAAAVVGYVIPICFSGALFRWIHRQVQSTKSKVQSSDGFNGGELFEERETMGKLDK